MHVMQENKNNASGCMYTSGGFTAYISGRSVKLV